MTGRGVGAGMGREGGTGVRTPVVLFAFNRADTTARVFDAIRSARPSRLLLVCDGARSDRAGEAERVAAVRAVLERVDWPCAVERHYSDVNMGCRARISSGIAWAFSLVDEAIFLEDDTLPDATFFPFCDALLDRYRDDERVLMISGVNLAGRGSDDGASYWFSAHPRIWGWAATRRAWAGYDVSMADWPALQETAAWRDRTRAEREGFAPFFDAVKRGAVDTWDAQVTLHAWRTGRLSIVPRTSLVANLGFGDGATNTSQAVPLPPVVPMEFPLRHPASVRADAVLDAACVRWQHGDPEGSVHAALRRAWHGARHLLGVA